MLSADHEDQLLCLGFLGLFDLPVGIALDFTKPGRLQVVTDVPISEESCPFLVTKYVAVVVGFDNSRLVHPHNAPDGVIVMSPLDLGDADSPGSLLLHRIPIPHRIYHPRLPYSERVVDVADKHAPAPQRLPYPA